MKLNLVTGGNNLLAFLAFIVFAVIITANFSFGQLVIKNNTGTEVMTVDNQGQVTIGTSVENGILTVEGQTVTQTSKVTDNASVRRVLVSDTDGNATWTNPPGDGDSDPSDEIHSISKSGNTFTPFDGGGSFTDAVNDAGASSTNELQSLTRSGSTVSLSGGGGSVSINDGDYSTSNETPVAGTGINVDGRIVSEKYTEEWLPSHIIPTWSGTVFYWDNKNTQKVWISNLPANTKYITAHVGVNLISTDPNTQGKFYAMRGNYDDWSDAQKPYGVAICTVRNPNTPDMNAAFVDIPVHGACTTKRLYVKVMFGQVRVHFFIT